MATTLAAIDAALKQYYKGGRLTKIAYDKHPLMNKIKAERNLFGRNTPLVPWFANTAGTSATFAKAQANVSAEKAGAFLMSPNKYYAIATIDMLAIAAANQDDATFLKALTDSVDGATRQIGRQMARQLYGTSSGYRGKIAAGGVSGATITLENPGDIVNFEVGFKIVQSADNITLGSGASSIQSVDRRAGKFTLASGTGYTAGDFLYLDGDFNLCLHGIRDWIPTTAPGGADNFLGQNRSFDSRLYGQYLDASTTGDTIETAIGKMDMYIAREGGTMDTVFLNPINFDQFRNALGSQAIYDKAASKTVADVSFSTINFAGQGAIVECISDPDTPQNEAVCLQMDSWVYKSVGEVPHISNANGGQLIAMASEDSGELRLAAYSELGCYAPAWNGRVKVA